MMKKDLKNKKLVSALTVGISAMMALATPVTAYANGEATAPPEEFPDTTTESEVGATEAEAPAVTQEAEDQAQVVADAAAGEATEDTSGEELQSAKVEAGAAVEEMLSSENAAVAGEAAGIDATKKTEADKAIDKVIEAANAVVNDGENDPSALSSLDAASEKATEVKQDLNDAGAADKQASVYEQDMENEAKAAFEDVKYATEKAEHMVQDSIETQEKADVLIESIKEAQTPEEANKAYEDLDKLVQDTKSTLDAMKEFYDNLTKQYEAASANLKAAEEKMEQAEKEFGDKIKSAEDKTAEAQKDIDAAQQKVDNLAGALELVGDKLDDAIDADALKQASGDNWAGKIGGDIKKNRSVMEQVVENYYLTQRLGIDVVRGEGYEIKWQYMKDGNDNDEKIKSFDKQECNAAKVTFYYRNDDGEIVQGKRYFNWDSAEKSFVNDNWQDGARASNGNVIVVYEKTEDEIAANKYLTQKYPGLIGKTSEIKEKTKEGILDVYAFNLDGERVYKVTAEINEMIASGEVVVNADGTMTLKDSGAAVDKISQNQNNLFHNADCLVVGADHNVINYTTNDKNNYAKATMNRLGIDKVEQLVKESQALNAFINGNATAAGNAAELAGKYAGFENATAKAQQAVQIAQYEADTLSEAINDLKSQKKRSVLATKALGVDDVASYFGIEVSAEKADELNKMTVREVLTELDGMLEESNAKVETAQKNLDKLKEGFGQAKTDLDNTLLRLNPRRPVSVTISDGVAGAVAEAVITSEAASRTPIAPVAPAATVAEAAAETPVQEAAPAAVDQRRAARQASENALAAGAEETVTGDVAEGIAQESATGETTTIEDGGVALAEAVETETGEFSEDENQAYVNIEDEATAKGVLEDSVKEEKMGLWWLLFIALFGEAGREMYAKHKKKQEEKLNK